jgi:hypothetical protein
MKKSPPYEILLQVGSLLVDELSSDGNNAINPAIANRDDIRDLSSRFSELMEFEHPKLDREDILLIAVAFHKYIADREYRIDPVTLLGTIYPDPASQIRQLDRIVKLLKYNVFYTEKKLIRTDDGVIHSLFSKRKRDNSPVKYYRYSLLEEDICFHRTFIRRLLGEEIDVAKDSQQPYRSNKEFLQDWFTYLDKLYEFSSWDFSDRRIDVIMDEQQTSELLEALQWKERIDERLDATGQTFPLADLVDEYGLDGNETIMVMYLVKEDLMGNGGADAEELLKLISGDRQEMYRNREYLSSDSKLVRNGLVQLADDGVFGIASDEVNIPPDITRRIIMRVPMNDEERISQMLKGDDIFTLLEPGQGFDDLILPPTLKGMIGTAIHQYSDNIEKELFRWGVYEGMLKVAGRRKQSMEPGLLMLFHGAPGTGKTFAAGAIANALGKKLLVSDVSRLMSKWVGGSEKNTRKMFCLFERIVRRVANPPVLLLNEADQFLSRRIGNPDDSVDIMYNSLQNIFLEAFERFRGIMIATTNLKRNLDTAFSRRFHLKVEFPLPGPEERIRLWRVQLKPSIPGSETIDVVSLATRFRLTGGQIKLIVRNACAEAAAREGAEKKLTRGDLEKYCRIEHESAFDRKCNPIGFIA